MTARIEGAGAPLPTVLPLEYLHQRAVRDLEAELVGRRSECDRLRGELLLRARLVEVYSEHITGVHHALGLSDEAEPSAAVAAINALLAIKARAQERDVHADERTDALLRWILHGLDSCPCCDGDPATVCDACEQHSCWAGVWTCEDSRTAGTVQKPSAAFAGSGTPEEQTVAGEATLTHELADASADVVRLEHALAALHTAEHGGATVMRIDVLLGLLGPATRRSFPRPRTVA